MDAWMDEWMNVWLVGWMDRWMGGWEDVWMDGWMDGVGAKSDAMTTAKCQFSVGKGIDSMVWALQRH